MKYTKTAFTLIEVMISIVLLAMMVAYLYSAVGILQTSNASLLKKDVQLEKRDFIFHLLYKDLFESNKASITTTQSKDFDILKLTTRNSLHDTTFPNVIYVVTKEDKKLIRIETPYLLALPIPLESSYMLYADEIANEVEYFKIYGESTTEQNQTTPPNSQENLQTEVTAKSNILVNIKLRNQKPIFFEIAR